MESRVEKILAKQDKRIELKVYRGHFATPNSHISHYFDMTTMKSRASEARVAAYVLSQRYSHSTVVDTIVCLDGTQIIGAYLAEELMHTGIMSMNRHNTIYVTAPELIGSGHVIFRDNCRSMIEHKNVLLLTASASTGQLLRNCIDSVHYYGGKIVGISSIFSKISELDGIEINTIFRQEDVPAYKSYAPGECELCRKKVKLDALINGYGHSRL